MTSAADSFDLDQVDRLLTTTKQVRKRMDLERPVPRELLLECIDIAQHAPMGGNLERNRWWTIVGTYPIVVLIWALPGLLAFELAMLPLLLRTLILFVTWARVTI